MADNTLRYEDFLNEVDPAYQEFAEQTHSFFLENNCKIELKLAKSGYLVSYSHTPTKRVIANFVFRKKGLVIRIYGDYVNKYIDFMQTLPAGMIKSIAKAPNCKRLIDPSTCNSKCSMGYDFTLNDDRYKKCRYNCFMFEVNAENIPFIKAILENEIKERDARVATRS